jgi:hypothetical protein
VKNGLPQPVPGGFVNENSTFLTGGTPPLAWREEAEVLPAADPLAEHVFGVDAFRESRLAGFDGAHEHRRR